MRHGNWLAGGGLLALSIFLLSGNEAASAPDDDAAKSIKVARKDVLDLAKDVEAGKIDAKKAVAAHKNSEDLLDVMTVFKLREKKGLGFGAAGKYPKADGIEAKIRALVKGPLTDKELKDQSAELLKMAYVNLAVAEIAEHYAPTKRTKGGKTAKHWKLHNAEWKAASKEFIAAVKAKNPPLVKKAARRLDDACLSCHTDFKE